MAQTFDPTTVETPSYIYDLAEVRSAHERLRAALPLPAQLYYSLKPNRHPAVLAQLATLGCRAEVSSPGELGAAIEAGFEATGILYTGPGKRDEDVRYAVRSGVREFSVDSPVGLNQLDRIGRDHGVTLSALLRINQPEPPARAGLTMTGGPSQFGVDLDWVTARPAEFADREHATLAGLHMYMGSNLHDEDALLAVFGYALEVAESVQAVLGRELPVLDLGGGFGAPYATAGEPPKFETLRDRLAELLDLRVPDWSRGGRRILFESGRYLSAGCGRLLTRVLDVKRSRGRRIVVLDTGVNHLGGMSGLGRESRIEPDLLVATGRAVLAEYIVAGPLCHPLDSWSKRARLPDVSVGDLLTVPNVGAYSLYAGLALFHGHPMPLEVVVDGAREVGRSRTFVRRSMRDDA
jgi:diaminopimelate decarboxylase